MGEPAKILTPRWTRLEPHPGQLHLIRPDGPRFRMCSSGRRSGKSERAKRWIVRQALRAWHLPDARFVAAAPTRDQAKKIFWEDLKRLSPPNLVLSISESELRIRFLHGAIIEVLGMDVPERVEGSPLDGIVLDEYGNMRGSAWHENVRPALSTKGRPGWAWFIGVPEGRNHYWDLYQQALLPTRTDWETHCWPSAEIIDPAEVEAAREELDELTFRQEYMGEFLSFSGQAYYNFDRRIHAAEELSYDPAKPLVFCFDFNVEPGVAVICQHQQYTRDRANVAQWITAVIHEVYIPSNSNTEAVCRKLISLFGGHDGQVHIYGDATGGARRTSALDGSDWDIVRRMLRKQYHERLWDFVPRSNPTERARVNAMNARLRTFDGEVRMLVDPVRAPQTVRDLEGVALLEGGSGEIDKKRDKSLTHLSDSLGYYVAERFPLVVHTTTTQAF